MINQAPIVRYTASVSENFFPNFWRKTFSAESSVMPDPVVGPQAAPADSRRSARPQLLAGYRALGPQQSLRTGPQ
jgi:hypothetical protein